MEAPQIYGPNFSAVELRDTTEDMHLVEFINIQVDNPEILFAQKFRDSIPVFHPPFPDSQVVDETECKCNDSSGTLTKFHPLRLSGHKMDDIVGLSDVKEEIRRKLVLPVTHTDLYRYYGIDGNGGFLLYGPPGNGKTAIAKAVACEINAAFFTASMSELDSSWSGEAERNVRHLFEAARDHPLSVIFFDDFDNIGAKRTALTDGNKNSILNELLVQMQGVKDHGSTVIVMAATNRPWEIDSALLRPGRFDTLIHVPLLDTAAREALFRKLVGDYLPEETDYGKFARMTEGFSGADVTNICQKAKIDRIVRYADQGESVDLIEDDVLGAIKSTQTSVDREDVERCTAYSKGVRSFPPVTSATQAYLVPDKPAVLSGYQ